METLSLVATSSERCLESFDRLISLLSGPQDKVLGIRLFDVTDAHSRFMIWLGNMGARQSPTVKSSLDYRLRDAPKVKDQILELLEDLMEALQDVISIASGERPNRVEDEPDSEPISEIEEIFQMVPEAISNLLRLTMVIQKATPRDRFSKAMTSVRDPFDDSFDIAHVGNKFPRLDSQDSKWFKQRLGNAITQRRQFLRYTREHREKKAKYDTGPTTSQDPTKQLIPEIHSEVPKANLSDNKSLLLSQKTRSALAPTAASTLVVAQLEEAANMSETGMSKSSFATSVDESNNEHALTVPSLHTVAKVGAAFECPFCWTIQTFRSQSAWRRHVLEDLRPYVCTFQACDLKLYADKNQWFEHELHHHRLQWQCAFCAKPPYSSKKAFHHHLDSSHAGLVSTTNIDALTQASKMMQDTFAADSCPFCTEWEHKLRESNTQIPKDEVLAVTATQFRNHLARHMEQLALFAIPRGHNESDSGDSGDSGDVMAGSTGAISNMSSASSRTSVTALRSSNFEDLLKAGLFEQAVEFVSHLDSDLETKEYDLMLHVAVAGIEHERIVLTKTLIANGADPNRPVGSEANTALHIAAAFSNSDILDELLTLGATGTILNAAGSTPLNEAAAHVRPENVEYFLRKGLSPVGEDALGRSPLHHAARQGNDKMVEMLCEAGASVESQDISAMIPLHLACRHGNIVAVGILLEYDSDVTAIDSYGNMPIHLAVLHDHEVTLDMLLNKGSTVNTGNKAGLTPLHIAAREGYYTMVETLLGCGSTSTARDLNGDMPLHLAAEAGYATTAAILVRHTPLLEPTNNSGWSPLLKAANNLRLSTVKELIKYNQTISNIDDFIQVAFLKAIADNLDDALEVLCQHGANPNLIDTSQWCPLLHAAIAQNEEAVEVLVRHGARFKIWRDTVPRFSPRGTKHALTILAMDHLVAIFRSLGKYEEVEEVQLAINQEQGGLYHGVEHPYLSGNRGQSVPVENPAATEELASEQQPELVYRRGEFQHPPDYEYWSDLEEQQLLLVGERKDEHGEDDHRYLRSLDMLGALYQDWAMTLLQNAVDMIDEGPFYPLSTSTNVTNLGEVLRKMLNTALQLYLRDREPRALELVKDVSAYCSKLEPAFSASIHLGSLPKADPEETVSIPKAQYAIAELLRQRGHPNEARRAKAKAATLEQAESGVLPDPLPPEDYINYEARDMWYKIFREPDTYIVTQDEYTLLNHLVQSRVMRQEETELAHRAIARFHKANAKRASLQDRGTNDFAASSIKSGSFYLTCQSLSIGSWSRVRQSTVDLIVFYSLDDKPRLLYYFNDESTGYKIEIPFSFISNFTVDYYENYSARSIRGIKLELTKSPIFFMDTPESGGFYQCGDFTEDQQASEILTHHLSGDARVLTGELANLVDHDAFRNRHRLQTEHESLETSSQQNIEPQEQRASLEQIRSYAPSPWLLVPYENLVRPDGIQSLGFLSTEQKAEYQARAEHFWKDMRSPLGANSPQELEAWQQLSDLSSELKNKRLEWKQENGLPIDESDRRPGIMYSQESTAGALRQVGAAIETLQPSVSGDSTNLDAQVNKIENLQVELEAIATDRMFRTASLDSLNQGLQHAMAAFNRARNSPLVEESRKTAIIALWKMICKSKSFVMDEEQIGLLNFYGEDLAEEPCLTIAQRAVARYWESRSKDDYANVAEELSRPYIPTANSQMIEDEPEGDGFIIQGQVDQQPTLLETGEEDEPQPLVLENTIDDMESIASLVQPGVTELERRKDQLRSNLFNINFFKKHDTADMEKEARDSLWFILRNDEGYEMSSEEFHIFEKFKYVRDDGNVLDDEIIQEATTRYWRRVRLTNGIDDISVRTWQLYHILIVGKTSQTQPDVKRLLLGFLLTFMALDEFKKMRCIDELDPVPAAIILDFDESDALDVSSVATGRRSASLSTPVIALVAGRFHDRSSISAALLNVTDTVSRHKMEIELRYTLSKHINRLEQSHANNPSKSDDEPSETSVNKPDPESVDEDVRETLSDSFSRANPYRYVVCDHCDLTHEKCRREPSPFGRCGNCVLYDAPCIQTRTIPGRGGSVVRIVLSNDRAYHYRIDLDKLRRCHYDFDYCGFRFKEISELVEHVDQVHRYPQDVRRTFKAAPLLSTDLIQTDPVELPRYYGIRAFECPFSPLACSREFTSFDACFTHSLIHFDDGVPPKSIHCPFCDTVFQSEDGRVAWQMRMEHAETHRGFGKVLYIDFPGDEDDDDFEKIALGEKLSQDPQADTTKKTVIAEALYDFKPERDDELPFRRGDLLEIVEKSKSLEEDGWCRAMREGEERTGLVPMRYLREIGHITTKPYAGPRAPRAGRSSLPIRSSEKFDESQDTHSQKFEELRLGSRAPGEHQSLDQERREEVSENMASSGQPRSGSRSRRSFQIDEIRDTS